MNEKLVSWLHISDFHFKAGRRYDQDIVLRAFLKSLPEFIRRFGKIDFVVASGDIANTGAAKEYEQATIFFDELIKILSLEKEMVIVVPGNHDIERGRGRGLKRTIQTREESDDYFNQTESIPHIAERQKEFSSWYNQYFHGIRSFNQDTTLGDRVNIGQFATVVPINTATFCLDDADFGKLFIGRRSVEEYLRTANLDGERLMIGVMHHPVNWMSPLEQSQVKAKLHENFDFVLSGHLHSTDIEQVVSSNGAAVMLAAGALYQTRSRPNTALFCSVDRSSYTISPIRYEDQPKELWTIDPSIFPKEDGFRRKFDFTPKCRVSSCSPGRPVTESIVSETNVDDDSDGSNSYEEDLFITADGIRLYVEPRIMDRPQEFSEAQDNQASPVTLDRIVGSSQSFMIVSKTEYGGTSLCGRLKKEFSLVRKKAIVRNARGMPNYRIKLERLFIKEIGFNFVLILDNVDGDRDERLLKELTNSQWFTQIILIASDRSLRAASFTSVKPIQSQFVELHIWSIARGGVRSLSAALFKTDNEEYVSKTVDKVYGDLLSMIIPLTPANVIMYLRILHSEGEFNPINHVEIVQRYLQQLLGRPSDAYGEGLNLKNKMEIMSAFAFFLYERNLSHFDETIFYSFIDAYKKRALLDIVATDLLFELMETKIIVRWGSILYIKYGFFFCYFLGRYIYSRVPLLEKFLNEERYFSLGGVVDVITGLSSDNELVLKTLTSKLELLLSEFSARYIKNAFDPLTGC